MITYPANGAPQPLDRFFLAPARFAAVVDQTGENPIACF
jgi:hypothetical protein